MTKTVIVSGVRTAFGKFGGGLSGFSAAELGGIAIKEALNHAETNVCLLAERAFLRTMEGGCSIPSFALARLSEEGVSITGGIVSLDGQTLLQETVTAPAADAEVIGEKLARSILSKGGAEILKDIRKQRGEV